MTLSELIDQVSTIGEDGRRLPDSDFINATNRALGYIYAQQKVTGEYSFLAVGEHPIKRVPLLKHKGNQREALPLAGRVYSLFVSGTGGFTLSGDDGFSYTEEFSTERRRFCGVLPEINPTITFFGELDFTVFDLVCYSQRRGDNDELIPDGSVIRRINLRERVADFAGFAGYPTDDHGAVIREVYLRDGNICYPEGFTGNVRVRYYRAPKQVSESSLHEPLDLPTNVAPFLALLVCSYMYFEADPELSERCLAQYKSFEQYSLKKPYSVYDSKYKVNDRWA